MARPWKLLTLAAVPALALAATSATGRAVNPPPAIGFSPVIDLGVSGGEPSIQDDGRGDVYITSPNGIPSGANSTTGVEFWRSTNSGSSFSSPTAIGSSIGGGDSDVSADSAGSLYTADLEAAAADVQFSGDHGASFSSPGSQTGAEDDREWLTPVGSALYVTYHDFANNVPLINKTTNPTAGNAAVWTTGGSIFGTNAPTNATFAADANGDTLVSKPVVDAAGDIFVLTNTSTAAQNLASGNTGPLDRLYISESTDGGLTFTSTLINDISHGGTNSGTWAHVFNQLAIDAGGNLYIAVAGTPSAPGSGAPNAQIYLIRGTNNGGGSYTWSAPIQILGSADPYAEVFPAIAVGQAGQVAVGYYKTQAVTGCAATCYQDFRNASNKFQFFISQTIDALDPTPLFTETQVTTTSPHPGGICTDGIFCGLPVMQNHGGNRNLADFESMTEDPTGHIELVIPADQDGATTHNLFYKQTTGALLVPGATNGNGTGNQTYLVLSTQTPEAPLALLLPLAGGVPIAIAIRRRRHARKAVDLGQD
jgi:hypothetical protein